MRRLTAYLSRLFATDAIILFGIVCFLLWLVNCLRAFDVISVKGQSILVLGWQALLTMPQLATAFFYICIGIGLARALQALQANRELHIIHTSHGMGSLWRASAFVTAIAVLCALFLSNFLEPYANRRLNVLNAEVAADMVSSTLRPGRFTQITPGVVLLIGSRGDSGEISEFFADDRRDPEMRRTYIAESAKVSSDGKDYVLELRNGSLQSSGVDGRFTEISFDRYDVNVDRLSQPLAKIDPRAEQDTVQLIMTSMESGKWRKGTDSMIINRLAEGLRVIGIAMVVLAMMAFPSGKRSRFMVPMEAVVLLIAFGERGISAYSPLGGATGAVVLIVVAGAALFWRTRPRRIPMAVTA
ncbi:LptF/LptG family permease [Devosia sp. 2618]|uniref:LptF/LptG family permease n=1 Tax=Devosia sp. 2618 TaxID=3156454 RepID=UPI0033963980